MAEQFLVCDLSLHSVVTLALGDVANGLGSVATYDCQTQDDFSNRLRRFLHEADNPDLLGAAVSTRGWQESGVVQAVGHDVAISRDDIRDLLGIQRVNVVNNFVARALAIPGLKRSERLFITGEDAIEGEVIAVLGPHHGLGAAALISDGMDGWTALPGEGGHSDLAGRSQREREIVNALAAEHGYVSWETALSLAGVNNIWQALHSVEGLEASNLPPDKILELAKRGHALAIEVRQLVSAWLGAFASDLALILGARGGVFLTGALIDMMGEDFDTPIFVDRFHDKGPRRGYLMQIPVYRTMASNLELKGLATLFE